jgi:hypothetical protein
VGIVSGDAHDVAIDLDVFQPLGLQAALSLRVKGVVS